MKKLAILSSLALLVAPSFKGNAFTDLARNQIKMIDEGTTTSSVNPIIITLGNETSDCTSGNYNSQAAKTVNYLSCNAASMIGTISVKNCFVHKSSTDSPLKVSSNNNAGIITLSLVDEMNVESITVRAKAYSNTTKSGASLNVTFGDVTKSGDNAITSSSWTDCTFGNFSGSSDSIVFKGNSGKANVLFISTITLKLASSEHTVTYDYGDYKDDSWKTTDTVTSGETLTPAVPVGTQYDGTDWYQNPTLVAWLKDDGTEFDFTKDTISEDTTLHAKWEVKKTTAVSNIETSETKAQLYYEYTATSGDTETTYAISKINLRFGGLVKKEYYDALEKHIKSVGMI